MRKAAVKRTTKETDVEVALDLDGAGAATIATGVGFLDHMLDLFARHSRMDLTVKAKGDLHIDQHHTTEDVGITLGQALKQALGDMAGITRYADVHVPMDETLTRVALDISGRPFLVFKVAFSHGKIGTFDTELVREWFQAFAMHSGITLRSRASRGWRGLCARRSRSTRGQRARCLRPKERWADDAGWTALIRVLRVARTQAACRHARQRPASANQRAFSGMVRE